MGAHSCPHTPTCSHAYAHSHPHVPTCMPTHTSTHSQAYAHAHPRLPPRALTYAHDAPTYAGGQSRNRSCVTHTHAWLPSHDGMGALCARALRIRTHGCPHTMAWAHYARERYAYARKRTGNHRASTFAHTSDLRPHYAPMSHAHTPMHAWGGGRQAHYAPSRNVVRGVTPMRRRGYALCVHGRNTMRDVTQLGVNGRKRVRLGTTWADASVCVWASGGVENPSWACMGAFGHTWTRTWVHTWVHEGQKFHFWDK